jgi:hypothetical protein
MPPSRSQGRRPAKKETLEEEVMRLRKENRRLRSMLSSAGRGKEAVNGDGGGGGGGAEDEIELTVKSLEEFLAKQLPEGRSIDELLGKPKSLLSTM